MKVEIEVEKLETFRETLENVLKYNTIIPSCAEEIQASFKELDPYNLPIIKETPKQLSSPQIAEFLDDIADVMAGYLYNCRKDNKDAQRYARFLDQLPPTEAEGL